MLSISFLVVNLLDFCVYLHCIVVNLSQVLEDADFHHNDSNLTTKALIANINGFFIT